jgi:hypothetical protein
MARGDNISWTENTFQSAFSFLFSLPLLLLAVSASQVPSTQFVRCYSSPPLPPNSENRRKRFEILRAVLMSNHFFWDMTRCIPLELHRRFERIVFLLLLCWNRFQGESKRNVGTDCSVSHMFLRSFIFWLIWSWSWRWYVSETSTDFQQTTRSYIPKDSVLKKDRNPWIWS